MASPDRNHPPQSPPPARPLIGVGIVCWRGDDVALIRRGKPPLAGHWSIPGGALEWGESLIEAAHRELHEETHLTADILSPPLFAESITRGENGQPGHHYVLIDFAARYRGGQLQAGSDAAEARWVPWREALTLVAWGKTADIITQSRALIAPAG